MKWDNGRTLSLNSDEDSFRRLTQEELVEEPESQDDGMPKGQFVVIPLLRGLGKQEESNARLCIDIPAKWLFL